MASFLVSLLLSTSRSQLAASAHHDRCIDDCIHSETVEEQEAEEEDAMAMSLLQSPVRNFDRAQVRANECTHAVLPKVLVIGLNHAGTTTVSDLLNLHPQMSSGQKKEHNFFIHHIQSFYRQVVPGEDDYYDRSKLISDYFSEFTVSTDTSVTHDASPTYWALGCPYLDQRFFRYAPGKPALERVRDILGDDLKLLYLVKDPLLWLTSIWSDKAGIDLENAKDFIFCQAQSLQNWMDIFGKEQIMFLDSAKMFINLTATADELYEFVGLPQRAFVIDDDFSSGRRRAANILPASQARSLTTDPRYRECKESIENITGFALDWSA